MSSPYESEGGPIFVMGATGKVGSAVVTALRNLGLPVRAAARDPRAARTILGEDTEAVRFDPCDPKTFASVAGSSAIFLQRPRTRGGAELHIIEFMREARRAGVRHIVFLSNTISPRSVMPRYRIERHLAATSGWTVLRPAFFSNNLADAYRRDIVDDGRIYVPAGKGRVAFVDVRDLAEAAAAIFERPTAHDQRTYVLTGSSAVGFESAAAYLSNALGRPIRYEAASMLGYARHLRKRRVPWSRIAAELAIATGLRLGQDKAVDPVLGQLLGRPPRSLLDYVNEHRSTWVPHPQTA